jgi:hypothetical protein
MHRHQLWLKRAKLSGCRRYYQKNGGLQVGLVALLGLIGPGPVVWIMDLCHCSHLGWSSGGSSPRRIPVPWSRFRSNRFTLHHGS